MGSRTYDAAMAETVRVVQVEDFAAEHPRWALDAIRESVAEDAAVLMSRKHLSAPVAVAQVYGKLLGRTVSR